MQKEDWGQSETGSRLRSSQRHIATRDKDRECPVSKMNVG